MIDFTELLKAEVWRKKLEGSGYRVITEAAELTPGSDPRSSKKIECQKCGTMYPSNSLCPCCG
jgi:hypothetical protein